MHLDVWLPYHFFVGVFSIEIIRALIKNQQVLVKTIPQTLSPSESPYISISIPKVKKERTIMYQGEDGWDQQPLMLGLHVDSIDFLNRLNVLVDHLKMALDCFFAIWFVVGNVWIFGEHSSATDAPVLYGLCIVFLTFSCIGYAMPFILCATICCCLPCIISILGFREDLGQTQGASSELINAFPTYKFKLKRHGSRECGEVKQW